MLNTIAKEFLKIYNALSRLVYVINTYFKILNKKKYISDTVRCIKNQNFYA